MDFFNLPMSEKQKFWQTPQHMEGFGQAFVLSEEQKLDWADLFFMTTLPKHLRSSIRLQHIISTLIVLQTYNTISSTLPR